MNWSATSGRVLEVVAHGPGNVVFIELESEHITEIFTAFGRMGVAAEQVAREATKAAEDCIKQNVPVGTYLADQLMLPLGISAWQKNEESKRGGSFRTLPLSRHSLTHIEILKQFLEINVQIESDEKNQTVTIASP